MVRQLTTQDAAAYFAVRLRALEEHPEAFGASADEWRGRSLVEITQRLSATESSCYFGAFVDGALAGIAAFSRPAVTKQAHRGGIYQMYVAPEHRRLGLGRQLLEAILSHVRQLAGLDEVVLSVTIGNYGAEALYAAAGFRASYVEPRYIKLDGRTYDLLWMSLRLEKEI